MLFFLVANMLHAGSALAQSGDNVLVVANGASEGSLAIAEHYVAARQVPSDQLLVLKVAVGDQIPRAEYERNIEKPIARWLAGKSRQDKILYIVLTRGIPVKIAGTSGAYGSIASVDSELALLYRRMTGVPAQPNGPIPNPYFAGRLTVDRLKPFSHSEHDIYLVTRLDGFSVGDVMALIDRGIAPEKTGMVVLDAPSPSPDLRTEWLETAASRLASQGFAKQVRFDNTLRPVEDVSDVLGYSSWGSNDPSLALRRPNFAFAPGAITSTFLSYDARTFVEPPPDWKPGTGGPSGDYAGSAQALTGDLVRAGVTGAAGQVAEPTFGGAVRPDVLFPAYFAGFNLAESFYMATPYLSWQTVIIGDPLCAPFRTKAQAVTDADVPLDTATELPALFSRRRLASMPGVGDSPALKLMVRAEARSARGDPAGAAEAFTQMWSGTGAAVTEGLASKAAAEAWRNLADAHQREGRYLEANDFYRRLIADNLNDIFALNNLAYNLATFLQEPVEALPLARRAATLAPGHPFVMHTLGWIHHLLGNNEEAMRLIDPVLAARAGDADVQFHAAVIYTAAGRLEEAAEALKMARKLNPAIERRDDFIEFQQKLKPAAAKVGRGSER